MLEDIVYLGENGEIKYDFRLSDTRLDYLVEKGYNLLIAYGGIPDCIAKSSDNKTSVSKNKTRYKGKLWNSYPPKDISLWEEVCFEYTKHLVERYGESTVASWHCHCFNEPDVCEFFLHDLPRDNFKLRCDEYCKTEITLYKNNMMLAKYRVEEECFFKSITGLAYGKYAFVLKQFDLNNQALFETDKMEFSIAAPQQPIMGRINRI